MIQLLPAQDDPDLYFYLAKNYIKEQRKFDKTVIWDNAKWDRSISNAKLIELDGEVVGFLTAAVMENKPNNRALNIQDFYIVPKWRRKRIGKKVVSETSKDWNGDIYLYILNKNMPAKSFWASLEREMNWYRKTRKDIPDIHGYDLRVYVKSRPNVKMAGS